MRAILIAAILMAGPLFIFVLTEGVRRMYETGGFGWFYAGCAAVCLIAWCFARLVDSRPPQ